MSITSRKVLKDLEELRVKAMEAGAFVPALRAIELMGRHIGMWQGEASGAGDYARLVVETPVTGPNSSPPAETAP